MSRLRADLYLLLVALIWGVAFVPQKLAFSHIGACTFVFSRFMISALLVAPFALREWRRKKAWGKIRPRLNSVLLMLVAFAGGVLFQQEGLATTSATNAGFLTGLYVIFVPIICRGVYGQSLSPWIFPAAFLSLLGTWLLSGGVSHIVPGDTLVVLCAVSFGLQVAMLGVLTRQTETPLVFAVLQYLFCASVAGVWMVMAEHPTLADIQGALWPILYAGVLSGGVAYTLQAVAQQYAPSSDAAIIMSGESLFAAIAGAIVLGDTLTAPQYAGCVLIAFAILMTEIAPYIIKKTRNS
jgi:drug/metabolite transporter (DMT)-like permease